MSSRQRLCQRLQCRPLPHDSRCRQPRGSACEPAAITRCEGRCPATSRLLALALRLAPSRVARLSLGKTDSDQPFHVGRNEGGPARFSAFPARFKHSCLSPQYHPLHGSALTDRPFHDMPASVIGEDRILRMHNGARADTDGPRRVAAGSTKVHADHDRSPCHSAPAVLPLA